MGTIQAYFLEHLEWSLHLFTIWNVGVYRHNYLLILIVLNVISLVIVGLSVNVVKLKLRSLYGGLL